jgi:hypothetical protein
MALASGEAVSNLSSSGSWASITYIQLIFGVNLMTYGTAQIQMDNNTQWVATDCVLYPAVSSISVNVTNSTYSEHPHPLTDPNTGSNVSMWSDPYPNQDASAFIQVPSWVDPNNSTFGLDYNAYSALEAFCNAAFKGNVAFQESDYQDPTAYNLNSNGDSNCAGSDVIEAIFYGNMSGCNTTDES